MDDARRRELKEFLRAHRERLRPEDAGLPTTPRRRTAGLRREEVAQLAGVGVTWYTWLEQGREIQPSREVLERIARALKLSTSDTEYLITLASTASADSELAPPLDPRIDTLLAAIPHAPALVVTPRLDVVTANPLACEIYDFDGDGSVFARNLIWRAYFDPKRRALYPTFDDHKFLLVGLLRANYASRVGDPSFETLLVALGASREFSDDWAKLQTVPLQVDAAFPLDTPTRGTCIVHSMRLPIPSTNYMLIVLPAADAATLARFAAPSSNA